MTMLPFARSLLILLIVLTGAYSQCNAPSLASTTPVYNATSSNGQLVIYCSNVILPATYLWQHNGDVIENAVDHVYVASVPVTEGIYRCGYTKTTCAGTIWSNDIVTVINKPTISLSPTSPNATYGDVVTLQCSANGGYPTPSITWYNGTGGNLGHTGNLAIAAVANDTFTCIAVNSAGYASGSIAVTVTDDVQASTDVQQSTTVSHYSSSFSSFIAASSSRVNRNSSIVIGISTTSSMSLTSVAILTSSDAVNSMTSSAIISHKSVDIMSSVGVNSTVPSDPSSNMFITFKFILILVSIFSVITITLLVAVIIILCYCCCRRKRSTFANETNKFEPIYDEIYDYEPMTRGSELQDRKPFPSQIIVTSNVAYGGYY